MTDETKKSGKSSGDLSFAFWIYILMLGILVVFLLANETTGPVPPYSTEPHSTYAGMMEGLHSETFRARVKSVNVVNDPYTPCNLTVEIVDEDPRPAAPERMIRFDCQKFAAVLTSSLGNVVSLNMVKAKDGATHLRGVQAFAPRNPSKTGAHAGLTTAEIHTALDQIEMPPDEAPILPYNKDE